MDQQTPFNQQKGRLAWPLQGKLAANFGQSRNIGDLVWKGVLIQAPRGEPVKAIHRGQVIYSDWFRGYGLLIIVDHGDEFMSLYGHNETLEKQIGEWVETGDTLATVGDSGGRNQAALYFELRNKGKQVDPKRWCRGNLG